MGDLSLISRSESRNQCGPFHRAAGVHTPDPPPSPVRLRQGSSARPLQGLSGGRGDSAQRDAQGQVAPRMPLVRVAAAARVVAVTGDGGFLMKSQELADKA